MKTLSRQANMDIAQLFEVVIATAELKPKILLLQLGSLRPRLDNRHDVNLNRLAVISDMDGQASTPGLVGEGGVSSPTWGSRGGWFWVLTSLLIKEVVEGRRRLAQDFAASALASEYLNSAHCEKSAKASLASPWASPMAFRRVRLMR